MTSRGEEFLRRIREGLAAEERRDETLNLIASQNVLSPTARAALASTLGQRSHVGGRHVDQVEAAMLDAAQTLYGTRNIEYRLMSGSLANQMAIVSAIPPGATVLVMPRSASGDKSVQAHGYLRWIGARVIEMPWDYGRHNVDLERLRHVLREHRPSWLIIGGSRPLFPYPVSAMRTEADAVGARILYDGSHILGLWAGGQFQDPLGEGADIVTGSTQKTLPGPLGGLLFCRDPELLRPIARLCDGVLGDYGNARVASIAVTLAELVAFGRDYAAAIVSNARALAQALAAQGFTIAAADLGFTASHQVLVLPDGWRAPNAAATLESVGIQCSLVELHRTADAPPVTGLRLGTSGVTRRGMTATDMQHAARLMARALLHVEDAGAIRKDVHALRASFPSVRYAFSA